MFVRLAFATQIFSEPDILIVDEALSVGDIRFQQKCYRAMDSLMKDKTVVLVTHDTAAVTRFCNRVIWINHGEKCFDGDVTEGLRQYKEYLINLSIEEKGGTDKSMAVNLVEEQKLDISDISTTIPPVSAGVSHVGNEKARITHCGLMDEKNQAIDVVEPGQVVDVATIIETDVTIQSPLYGITVKDRLGNDVIALNSETISAKLPEMQGRKYECHLKFRIPELNQGKYVMSVAIANGSQLDHVQLCWLEDIIVFQIPQRTYDVPGTLYLEQGDVKIYKVD